MAIDGGFTLFHGPILTSLIAAAAAAVPVVPTPWAPDGSRLLTLPLERALVWLDSVPARNRAAPPGR
jgi:hypothetical protein